MTKRIPDSALAFAVGSIGDGDQDGRAVCDHCLGECVGIIDVEMEQARRATKAYGVVQPPIRYALRDRQGGATNVDSCVDHTFRTVNEPLNEPCVEDSLVERDRVIGCCDDKLGVEVLDHESMLSLSSNAVLKISLAVGVR